MDNAGYKVIVDGIEILDDWSYTNHQVINYCEETINLNEMISNGKIIIANLKVNGLRSGYYILKVDNGIYEIGIWFDTDKMSSLDSDAITDENEFIYNKITNAVINNIDNKKLLLIGIGVETIIEYDRILQNIVDNSKNILIWILPRDKKINIQHFYKKEEKEFFNIYFR